MSAAIKIDPSLPQNGDALVKQWTPLARHLANSYSRGPLHRWYETEDLLVMAQAVIWECALLWKSDRGASFKTYAYNAIVHKFEGLRHYWRAQKRQGARREDSVDQDSALECPRMLPLASGEIGQDQQLATEEILGHLRQALKNLDPRQRAVLEGRFGHERALPELGVELGVSRERIRQLETKALNHLRRALSEIYPEVLSAPPVTSGRYARARTDDDVKNQQKYRERRKVALSTRVT